MKIEESSKKEQLVTIEECPRCHVRFKRVFRDGDFIGKSGGICAFCGERMVIVMIYKEAR